MGDVMTQQNEIPSLDLARQGQLANPDGHGCVRGTCGDTVEIYVQLRGDRVERASFVCDGCAYTAACASTAASLLEGKSLAEARRSVSPAAIATVIGGLPRDHEHCAALATYSAHEALDEATIAARDPWRKLYRR